MSKSTDIEDMRQKLVSEYGCVAEHAGAGTSSVRVWINSKTAPEFQVETFRIYHHAAADTAFAWMVPTNQKEKNKPREIITRLKSTFIGTPSAAVNDWAAGVFFP